MNIEDKVKLASLIAQAVEPSRVFLLTDQKKVATIVVEGTNAQGFDFLCLFANHDSLEWDYEFPMIAETPDAKRRRRVSWFLKLFSLSDFFAHQNRLWYTTDIYVFPPWWKEKSFSPAFWSDNRASTPVLKLLNTALVYSSVSGSFQPV